MTKPSISQEMAGAEAHHRAGRLDFAVQIYRRVVAADPAHAEATKMLAIALFQSGATAEAEIFARRAHELKSTSPDAANILAAILGRNGRYAEAVRVLENVGPRIAKFPGMCLNLGLAYRGNRDFVRAADWLQKAIAGDPKLHGAHINLGMVLSELGRRDEAAAAFREALAGDPADGSARHMLAALEGVTPAAPPADYVRGLFNDYAPRFERELTKALGYRVPEILRRQIDHASDEAVAAKGPRRFARGLDLGCGTGLSGAAIRDCVDELIGVDLAEAMIAEARAKKIYNALFAMDLLRYLVSNDAQRKPFDLAIAADVFIYVGDLDASFAQLAARMVPGGLFAYSVERCATGFVLQDTGRYAHSRSYIDGLAARHGFAPVAFEDIAVRKAHDGSVDGYAVVLRKR